MIVEVDQIYKIINRIQITREPADFIIREMDTFVVENVLRDAGLEYSNSPARVAGHAACKHFKIQPPKAVEPRREDFDDFEEFPDEIIEDGQIFF